MTAFNLLDLFSLILESGLKLADDLWCICFSVSQFLCFNFSPFSSSTLKTFWLGRLDPLAGPLRPLGCPN